MYRHRFIGALENETSIPAWREIKTIMAVTLTAALAVFGSLEPQFRRLWRCSSQVREARLPHYAGPPTIDPTFREVITYDSAL